MEKKDIIKALEELKKISKKRNFTQSVDLIFNLKHLDIKKPDEKIDAFVVLPKGRGKDLKVCAFVDDSLYKEAEKYCDVVVHKNDFQNYAKNKKDIKKLANSCDHFIAQANLMPEIAKVFGKFLGSRGKMPNPKAGGIVPPKINLQGLVEKFKKTIRIQTKNELTLKCPIGTEDMSNEDLAENATAVYNAFLHNLKEGKKPADVITSLLLKFTMSKPTIIGGGKK